MRKLRRQGAQPTPAAIERRRAAGVPEGLLYEPIWLIAKHLKITEWQLRKMISRPKG